MLSFLVFSFRGPSARYSVVCCKIVAFLPCASLATFVWGGTCMFSPFSELATYNFVNHDDCDWSEPQDTSWCPVTSSFGEPPTAGRQRVFSWVATFLSSSHTWETLPLRGRRGPGQSVRASVLLSRVLKEARNNERMTWNVE